MTASALRHGMIRRRSKRSQGHIENLPDGATLSVREPAKKDGDSPGKSGEAPGHNKDDTVKTNHGQSKKDDDTTSAGSDSGSGVTTSVNGGGGSPPATSQGVPLPTPNPGNGGGSGGSPPGGSGSSGGPYSSGGSGGSGSSGSSGDNSPNTASSDSGTGSGRSASSTHPLNVGDDPAPSSATRASGSVLLSPTVAVSATVPNGGISTPNTSIASPNPTSSSGGPVAQGATRRNNRGAIAGGIVGGLLLLFLAFAAWTIYKRRRKNHIAPSMEYLANPSAYPFASVGFGAMIKPSEKGNNYGGVGQGAAGQAKFKALSTDSKEEAPTEKYPVQKEVYRDQNLIDPLPPPPQPEILYSTPARVATSPTVPAAAPTPGTPTSPNGRRIPFGTGTFQFPPRPLQPQPQ